MSFSNQPIRNTRPPARKTSLIGRYMPNRLRAMNWSSIWSYILGSFLLLGLLAVITMYMLFFRDIPPISGLADMKLSESTIIYDREGNEIYKLYTDGKRTYVEHTEISDFIKKAIVSAEDKTFYTNNGVDPLGIVRAIANYVRGSSDKIKGTSTLSQQLIKNTLLTNDPSLKRKVQEAYLSYQLNSEYTKDKILELYLNTISFGNNASGIEEAAKTYFGKSAKDVGILGATILASLPKGPTYYSPYIHRDRLLGYVYMYSPDTPDAQISLESTDSRKKYAKEFNIYTDTLKNLKITQDNDRISICGIPKNSITDPTFVVDISGCTSFLQSEADGRTMAFLYALQIPTVHTSSVSTTIFSGSTDDIDTSGDYILAYSPGRKDFVAGRMLEDGYITPQQYQSIAVDGLSFEFRKNTEAIKYPYFVFSIKEYLETIYGDDMDITNGLRVYTTIDPKLQEKAEILIKNQVAINIGKYGASSAALVSIDNPTGQILSYVGGVDYFDEKNGGNNNMLTAMRQPGSSFKPLVYALAISKNAIGAETPISDLSTTFGKWKPDNYDTEFKGGMMVKTALAYSRNIPAAKMFYLAGGEDAIISTLGKMGVESVKKGKSYGAPMALGTAEMKPIELAQIYTVLANGGKKRTITGILKIEDTKGNILEEYKETEAPEVFSPGASYIVSLILSDINARPSSDFWRNALSIPGHIVAAKTGTSNKDVSKNGVKKILPRDLWTAGYTPQITTVVWAGNVDGSATKSTCDGLNCAAPIWKAYMGYALASKKNVEFTEPKGMYKATISKLSGKLASENTPDSARVSTLLAVKPTLYDMGVNSVDVDTLCGGPVSPDTPQDAISTVYISRDAGIIDGYDPGWRSAFLGIGYNSTGTGSRSQMNTEPCIRPRSAGLVDSAIRIVAATGTLEAGRRLVEVNFAGDRPIVTIRIYQDQVLRSEISYGSGGKLTGIQRASVQIDAAASRLHAELTDSYGYTYDAYTSISVVANASAPKISTTNPVEGDASININSTDFFNLRFTVDFSTAEREINVLVDGVSVASYTSGAEFVVPINESRTMTGGLHSVTIRAVDGGFRQVTKNLTVTVL